MNRAFIPCLALVNSANIGREGTRGPGPGQGGGPTGGGRGSSGGGRGGGGGTWARTGPGDIRRIHEGCCRSLGERLRLVRSGGKVSAFSFEGRNKGGSLASFTVACRCFLCPLRRPKVVTGWILQVEAWGTTG